jgi:hypothetical protein
VWAFNKWCPSIDGVVDDLKIEVNKQSKLKVKVSRSSKHWDRVIVDGSVMAPRVFASTPMLPTVFVPNFHSDTALNTKGSIPY